MKVSRNDPCPCGSGKKFKKCCLGSASFKTYEKNETKYIDSTKLSQENLEKMLEQMEADEMEKRIFGALQQLRAMSMKEIPHIKKYKACRLLLEEIVDSMIEYNESGKFKQHFDQEKAKQYLTLNPVTGKPDTEYSEVAVNLESDLGFKIYMDLLIYRPVPHANSIIEVYLSENKYRRSDKIDLLHAMDESILGLFLIKEVEPENAYVFLEHVFTGEQYQIIDIAMSGSNNVEGQYIYLRIITFDGISFSTGFGMPFKNKDVFIKNFISEQKSDYNPLGEMTRMFKLYSEFSTDEKNVKVLNTNPFQK